MKWTKNLCVHFSTAAFVSSSTTEKLAQLQLSNYPLSSTFSSI